MAEAPEILNPMNNVQTAAQLRHQLHAMKAQDRQAVQAAPLSGNAIFTSPWFTAGVTGAATFVLLYLSNPVFVQTTNMEPNMRKILAWSILVILIVGLGPMFWKGGPRPP